MIDVLVLNGTYHNALAAVRSLGQAGLSVAVGVSTGTVKRFGKMRRISCTAAMSRYARSVIGYRDPLVGSHAFIEDILDAIKRLDVRVLLPVGLDTVVTCSIFTRELGRIVALPFPPFDDLEVAHDKARMLELARLAEVSVPRSTVIGSREEILTVFDDYPVPAVLKARRNTGSQGWRLVRSTDEAIQGFDEITTQPGDGRILDFSRPLLQEYIPGGIWDACVIAQNGQLKAFVGQRRILTIPPDGGAGILNETVERVELLDIASKVVAATGWSGVGQIELKEDASGRLRLMEFNPKFWGTLALSIEAGVNFPLLAYHHALGEQLPRDLTYRVGVRYRWLIPVGLLALVQTRSRWQFVKEMYRPHTKSDWWWSDVGPGLHQRLRVLRGVVEVASGRRRITL